MKTTTTPAGFVLLCDNVCCGISGGMASGNIDQDVAYMLGKILGRTFRILYDLGDNWWQRLTDRPSVATAF